MNIIDISHTSLIRHMKALFVKIFPSLHLRKLKTFPNKLYTNWTVLKLVKKLIVALGFFSTLSLGFIFLLYQIYIDKNYYKRSVECIKKFI